MQKFRVEGADRDTGLLMAIVVDAENEAHAERIAASKDILVRTIERDGLRPVDQSPNISGKTRQKRHRRRWSRTFDYAVLGFTIAIGLAVAETVKLGAIVAAVGASPASSVPPFVPRELAVVGEPVVPASVLGMRPMESGVGADHPVHVVSDSMTPTGANGKLVTVAWRVVISNNTGADYNLRLAPTLIGPDGDRVWHKPSGTEITVPPGTWVLRRVLTIPQDAYDRSVVAGFYRW